MLPLRHSKRYLLKNNVLTSQRCAVMLLLEMEVENDDINQEGNGLS